MRRYAFRLAPVLRVRRHEEDRALATVLAARAVLADERAALAQRDHAYSRALAAHGSRRAADWVVEQAHRKALAAAVLDQRRRVQQSEQVVEQALALLAEAAGRVTALERLDERKQAEHSARALREEELTVDDLVVARFGTAVR